MFVQLILFKLLSNSKRKISGGNYCIGCNGHLCGECAFEVISTGQCQGCNQAIKLQQGLLDDQMVSDLLKLIYEYEKTLGREFLKRSVLNVREWNDVKSLLEP